MKPAFGLSNPADMLLGFVVDGGWRVAEKISRLAQATGGQFSVNYVVESKSGERAFLKALDYSSAKFQPDVPRALQAMTSAFNYERDILYRCARMSRVVTAMSDGEIRSDDWDLPVNYLIFEWADSDSRIVFAATHQVDLAWCLRTLHQIAVGLRQLHGRNIAHQDLKPSNVLIFNEVGAKIGDLGRSSYRGVESPFDVDDFAGDLKYAPPELLYGYISDDWTTRRMASDMYQLGSLVAFFLAGVGMTGALLTQLDDRHYPRNWAGTFLEVLPFVRQAFVKTLQIMESGIPVGVRNEATAMVRQLCDPDPAVRGHPKNKVGHHNPYELERYISWLDRLASRAEYGLFRNVG